jgi:hypothetical protein
VIHVTINKGLRSASNLSAGIVHPDTAAALMTGRHLADEVVSLPHAIEPVQNVGHRRTKPRHGQDVHK